MTIADWFHIGCPYSEGVELYAQFGRNSTLLSNFKSRQNKFNTDKLHYELTKLLPQSPHLTVPTIVHSPQPTETKSELVIRIATEGSNEAELKSLLEGGKGDVDQDVREKSIQNPEYLTLLRECRENWKRATYLLLQLDHTENEGTREKMCFEILDLRQSTQAGWDKLDYFDEHGKWPELSNPLVVMTDPIELMKRRNTLRTYISGYKSGKRKGPIAEWEAELDIINKKLS